MDEGIRQALLTFITTELGVSQYIDSTYKFSEYGIESFQVLEIVLELERQLKRRISLIDVQADGLSSLEALLTACTDSTK